MRPTPEGFEGAPGQPEPDLGPSDTRRPAQVQGACFGCFAAWLGVALGEVVVRPWLREGRHFLGEAALSVNPKKALCRLGAGPRGADAGRVLTVPCAQRALSTRHGLGCPLMCPRRQDGVLQLPGGEDAPSARSHPSTLRARV